MLLLYALLSYFAITICVRHQFAHEPHNSTIKPRFHLIGHMYTDTTCVGCKCMIFTFTRNWRLEQEIAGLLWRISREDLKTSDSLSGSERRDSFGSRVRQITVIHFINNYGKNIKTTPIVLKSRQTQNTHLHTLTNWCNYGWELLRGH